MLVVCVCVVTGRLTITSVSGKGGDAGVLTGSERKHILLGWLRGACGNTRFLTATSLSTN